MNLLIDSLPYTQGPKTPLQRLGEVCSRELKKIEYEEYVAAKAKQWEERKLAQAVVNEVNRNEEVCRRTFASFHQPADNPPGQTPLLIGDQKHHQAAITDENGNEKVSHMMYAVFSQPAHSTHEQMPLITYADGCAPGRAVAQPPPEASPFKTPTGRGAAALARERGGAKRARLANTTSCGGVTRIKAKGSANAPDAVKTNAFTHEGGGSINANVCAHYYTPANGQVAAQAGPVGGHAKMFYYAPEGVGARPWHVALQQEGGARGFECALCGGVFELAPLLALHLRAQHGVEGVVVQAAPGAAVAVVAPLPLPQPLPLTLPLPAHPADAR